MFGGVCDLSRWPVVSDMLRLLLIRSESALLTLTAPRDNYMYDLKGTYTSLVGGDEKGTIMVSNTVSLESGTNYRKA
jgi:hypothetical protein